MSELETGETSAVTATFGEYVQARTDRLAYLDDLLDEALPILEHYDEPRGVNCKLVEAGLTRLVLADQAHMTPINRPEEIGEYDNFVAQFSMPTGHEEAESTGLGNRPRSRLIIPKDEEILALRDLPIHEEEREELRDSGKYPALYMRSHADKPAFIRMINLWPDFTTCLVKEITGAIASDDPGFPGRFESEFYVAYQLMSRLIDKADGGQVLKKDGEVAGYYLTSL